MGNLVGMACVPVGLQNIDDSDVEEQSLPTPIHCWDPTHPVERDSDQLSIGGPGSQLGGPPHWEQMNGQKLPWVQPEQPQQVSMHMHTTGHGCLRHPEVLMQQACPMGPSPVSDGPQRLSGL